MGRDGSLDMDSTETCELEGVSMAEGSIPTSESGEHKSPNLFTRLMRAQAQAKALSKSSTNSKGKGSYGYDYVSHDDTATEAKRILTDNGVLFFPTIDEVERDGNMTIVHVIATFYNVDDPEEKLASQGVGYGIDTQDKGIGKAYSYACKYILAKTLLLNTSDDIEQHSQEFKPAKALENAENDVKLWSSNLKRAIENCDSYDALKQIRKENSEMMKRPIVPDVTRDYFENEFNEKLSVLGEAIVKEVSEDA